MKFNQIHHLILVIVISLLGYNKVIYGDNSVAKKWHIIGDSLYYIEVERKYNSSDALQFCKSIGMINNIRYHAAAKIGKYLDSINEYVPYLWSPHFNDCELDKPGFILYRDKDGEMMLGTAQCVAQLGFVCSSKISYGEIKFKNGMQLFLNRGDVIKYCDPQAKTAYDQENCLIFLD